MKFYIRILVLSLQGQSFYFYHRANFTVLNSHISLDAELFYISPK